MTLTMLGGIALLAVILMVAFMMYLLREVAVDLAKGETRAWLPHISQGIVKRAANDLPTDQREILEAWEAELQEYQDRPLTMLIVAVRIARDRKPIARELQEASLETAGSRSPTWQTASFGIPLVSAATRAIKTITQITQTSLARIYHAWALIFGPVIIEVEVRRFGWPSVIAVFSLIVILLILFWQRLPLY